MQNLNTALMVCVLLGVSKDQVRLQPDFRLPIKDYAANAERKEKCVISGLGCG